MKEKTRLTQLVHSEKGRKIALVREPNLILLKDFTSIYHLALESLDSGIPIQALIEQKISSDHVDYDSVYNGTSEWKLLPSFDNPDIASHCIVSGTGLTHHSSALNRQVMHQSEKGTTLTDSMIVYQWGIEGGKPDIGRVGIQPEWFYKGTGTILKGHGEELNVPNFGNDGGEEPEIAGVYLVDRKGQPVRIGFTTGNEFSDHVMEKKNYLYLAPSKLRNCSIGPELVLTMDFLDLKGSISVSRGEDVLWSSDIQTGEKNMAHSLSNLEYHHFKYPDHRQQLQGHVHFFGTGAFSFGAGINLQTGDQMKVEWDGMGRPLINTVFLETGEEKVIQVKTNL
ncbi:AraD1 family protein [Algoriphagus sp. D3-2-R+10]|uniref:AraD1 family protein n=1 Tax=Algoriphagus aurantiacus TaxID=3103948 RepID=UPI002B3889FC|nr:AraD1 family protein [Algoriphagus sp. D3-2-R+10]MEB2776314.1 AraD1 family protein [Algoriphagus sp. D3-2-R+10]